MLQFSHRSRSILLRSSIAPLRRGEPPRRRHAPEAAEAMHGLRNWKSRFELPHFLGEGGLRERERKKETRESFLKRRKTFRLLSFFSFLSCLAFLFPSQLLIRSFSSSTQPSKLFPSPGAPPLPSRCRPKVRSERAPLSSFSLSLGAPPPPSRGKKSKKRERAQGAAAPFVLYRPLPPRAPRRRHPRFPFAPFSRPFFLPPPPPPPPPRRFPAPQGLPARERGHEGIQRDFAHHCGRPGEVRVFPFFCVGVTFLLFSFFLSLTRLLRCSPPPPPTASPSQDRPDAGKQGELAAGGRCPAAQRPDRGRRRGESSNSPPPPPLFLLLLSLSFSFLSSVLFLCFSFSLFLPRGETAK